MRGRTRLDHPGRRDGPLSQRQRDPSQPAKRQSPSPKDGPSTERKCSPQAASRWSRGKVTTMIDGSRRRLFDDVGTTDAAAAMKSRSRDRHCSAQARRSSASIDSYRLGARQFRRPSSSASSAIAHFLSRSAAGTAQFGIGTRLLRGAEGIRRWGDRAGSGLVQSGWPRHCEPSRLSKRINSKCLLLKTWSCHNLRKLFGIWLLPRR